MPFPVEPTEFKANNYRAEWSKTDFFYTQDGIQSYPKHPCKKAFNASLPFIKTFENAIDVGSRDGEYSRYLQAYFKHIYCFEPRKRHFFPFNVDLNKITHFRCALGDKKQKIKMWGGTHKIAPSEDLARSARCFRLDEFGIEDVSYIKIDVEGFEKKVLVGAERTIMKNRPVIVVEQNDVCLPDEEPFAAKIWLEEHGYRHAATSKWDLVMVPEE